MSARNALLNAPPYPIASALATLGSNLRTARLRRNLTIEQVAAKTGTGPRAVADAEKDKPGAAAATYVALLWIYDLLDPVAALADPLADEEGLLLARARAAARQSTRRVGQ